jgi:hypothetical protein
MKHFLSGLAAVLVLSAAPSPAQERQAEPRDIQRLQQDLENLDEDLQGLDARSPSQNRQWRDRADDIRDQTTYLKVKINRRQEGAGTGVTLAEVDELRRQVRDLRRDIGTRNAGGSRNVQVPAGTEVSLRLEQGVSSATAQHGPEARGIVREAEPAERLRRAGRLQLEFDTLNVDNRRQDIRTRIVSLQQEEGSRDTARKAGIGAIIGGVVGGLLKGRTGAVIGVLAGSGVVMAQRGEDVDLPEGTILKVRLERAVTLDVPTVDDSDYREFERN